MTTYETNATRGGMLQPAAPVDPKQVRDVAQHASEVFGPSARLKGGRDSSPSRALTWASASVASTA